MFKILILLFSVSVLAQVPTEKAIMDEANRRNIDTVEKVLDELSKNGISENQAKELARQQGISFDDFLKNNFTAKSSMSNAVAFDPDTTILLSNKDSISNTDEFFIKEPLDLIKPDTSFFGYSIFDKNPFLEKEYLLGNIDEGYLVAPGDALRIIVFGNNSLELEAVVDRNGNINIPDYGLFFAAGNSFKTLKSRLKIYLGKFFSGLLTTPQNTFLDISLTQLKPTKVVVVGQVNAPGPQILTTQANPLAALYAAGGVKNSGSLREVRIYRNNKLLKKIDLYNFISSGNITNDIRLTNNDVVFVPPRISTVLLEGEVKESGFYELKTNETLSDLISFSGGLPVNAARDRINILRVDPSNQASDSSDKSFITLNLNAMNSSNSEYQLFDGDKVSILPLLDEVSNRVSIQGNVYSPGDYSLTNYNDLKALIINAARGVKEDTYFDKVDIKGVNLPSGEENFATYNLTDILSGAVQVSLSDRDQVMVYSNDKVLGPQYVYISGYGIQKDLYSYETLDETKLEDKEDKEDKDNVEEVDEEEEGYVKVLWRNNLSIYDLVFENTAFNSLEFKKDLFDSRIDLKSYDYKSKRYQTRPFDFSDLSKIKKVFLNPYDRVVIYQKNVVDIENNSVIVSGFVNNPGSFELEKNMYVEDAILLAGGFSDLADQSIVYVNTEEKDPRTEITSLRYDVKIDMDYIKGQKKFPENGFILGRNDIVSIRKDLAFEEQQSIKVSGEVLYPRTVVAESNKVSLDYILDQVGGLSNIALLESSYVVRDSLTLALNLNKLNKNQPVFQNGDQLFISKNYGSVTTEGALENPSIFNWDKGSRAKDYLRNSGGKLNKIGGKAYVVLTNGQTKKINLFKNPRVYPGSKVVVNYKPIKQKEEGKFLNDVTNIFGTITGALTTILLLERL